MTMNNQLSKAIQDTITEVNLYGSSSIRINERVSVMGEWEALDSNEDWDVVTVYILQDNKIVFRYQEELTSVIGE